MSRRPIPAPGGEQGRTRALADRSFRFLLVLVSLCKLGIAWAGWAETTILSDDAFYYFTIARNVVRGAGASFDGVAPTNGFHPLWLCALLPLFAATPDSMWTPIRAALSLTVVFDLATAWLLFRTLDGRLGRGPAQLAALLWLCMPATAILAFVGMEGSLVALLLIALLRTTLDTPRRSRTPKAHAIGTGVLWGLCGLARTDQILLCGCALLAVVCRYPGSWRQRCRWVVLAAAAAALVLAPWFAWNWATFGTLEQVSSKVKRLTPFLWGSMPQDWGSPAAAIATAASRLFAPVVTVVRWLCVEDLTHHDVRWSPGLVAALLVPGLWLAARGARRMRARAPDLLRFTLCYLVVHVVAYGFILGFYAHWYASPVAALGAMLVGASVSPGPRWPGRLTALALGMLVVAQVTLVSLFARGAQHGRRGAEHRWRSKLERLQERHAPPVRMGLFDAGAAGYVAGWYPRVRIVNLDGLVNNEAVAAIERGRYPEYLAANVDMFVQSPRRTRIFLDDEGYARLVRLFESRGFDPRDF